MKKIVLIAVMLVHFCVSAQEFKFGKVSKEELQEQFYPLDSSAKAAYLYKYRRSFFNYIPSQGFQLITEIHERIKIYNKEGFDYATKLENYYVPEHGDSENVSSIKAYTFYLDKGKVVKEKLTKDGIFKEKLNDNFKQLKITMPKIKEGCVLDIKYKIYSPYAEYIDDVSFQESIPIKHLKNLIEIPEYFIYKQIPKGYFSIPAKKTSKPASIGDLRFLMQVYNYNGKDLPAIKDDEPFVSSVNSYKGGVKLELTSTNFTTVGGEYNTFSTTWSSVSKQIYKSSAFGGELQKTSYFKKDVEALLAGAKTDFEKVAIIFQYVKSTVKWNGGYGKYTNKGVKKAYTEKTGNVADINLMLTAMLRYAGLNANPVLVSSRGNGIPVSPTLSGFDYVISSVTFADNTYALLDATELYSLPNLLPVRALNWNGRMVRKDGSSSWVKLTSTKKSFIENIVMLKFAEDLVGEGMIRTKFENLSALNYRRNKNHIKTESLITKYEEDYNLEVDDFKVVNQLDLSKPIVRTIKFIGEDLVEEINGKLYIEPMLFLSQNNNPFKLEERKFPVDFDTPWKILNRITMDIPKGYKVEKLPETIAIGLPNNLGVFKFQVSQVGDKIKTTSILEFNNALIVPLYYTSLKGFYGNLVRKQSEKIVLVKE